MKSEEKTSSLYEREILKSTLGGSIMESMIKIGIIGDYDGRPSHLATQEAIRHCAAEAGILCEASWLPTTSFEQGTGDLLNNFDGLWCAPGSPYQSMWGAINAIQFARENNVPFIGTCGGFQHAALEFARDVLLLEELKDSSFDPYSPNIFITSLSCSLVAQTRHIYLNKNTKLHHIYGITEIEEKYNCSFGLIKEFEKRLDQNGFQVAGSDEAGEARILIIERNRFYIATLFQPQLSSTAENPHPLILSFLSHARDYHNEAAGER